MAYLSFFSKRFFTNYQAPGIDADVLNEIESGIETLDGRTVEMSELMENIQGNVEFLVELINQSGKGGNAVYSVTATEATTIHVDKNYFNFAVHYVLTMAADVEVNFIDDTTGTMVWLPEVPTFENGNVYEVNILQGVGVWIVREASA